MTAITEAEFNHPLASRLLWGGISTGNLLKASMSLHIIQDTAGHAGFTAETGHATDGHHPDRPWIAIEKYRNMLDLAFQALVAMRRLAPDEALDPQFRGANKSISDGDALALAASLWEDNDFRETVSRDIFRFKPYTKPSVEYIIGKAQQDGLIDKNVKIEDLYPADSEYTDANGKGLTAQEVLTNWVVKLRHQEIQKGIIVDGSIFDMAVMKQLGHGVTYQALINAENIKDPAARAKRLQALMPETLRKELVRQVVKNMTRGQIPMQLDQYHKVEFEAEGPVRALEASLRINALRLYIFKKYNVNIEFESNTLMHRLSHAIKSMTSKKAKAGGATIEITEPAELANSEKLIITYGMADRFGALAINIRNIFDDWTKEVIPNFFRQKIGMAPRIVDQATKTYQVPVLFEELILTGKIKPLASLDNRTVFGNRTSGAIGGFCTRIIGLF